ncbi:hypothetical protein [Kribbella sp. NPDC050459]|jgi:hypothetical protein|uniref:hypothetical protein n=1 Tax=Kribbella sp. NPDC050459 TaxID=3155785 RepID=UPI002F9F04BB
MTDLRELLRTTAAEGAEAVDLAEDVVADRIRRRRTHTKHLTVGGVAVAAAAAIAGTTWLVRPAGETPAPASGPVPRIVRSDVDTPAVMEALLGTTLSADANGCVQAGSDPTAVTLVWPRGYTVHGNAQSFEILDQANNVVARSGVPLDIGGGGVDHFQPTWTGKDCATATRFWWVGHISQR